MRTLRITQDTREGVCVLTVSGFLDMASLAQLESAMDALFDLGVTRIVLDLSFLEFITSAGLGAIIGRIRRARQQGGDIKVGGCSDRILEVFETFGFTEVFQISPSVEAALAEFSASKS
jgi:anti-sigma B factor antagonist